MSKLVVIMCVVLLASATNATFYICAKAEAQAQKDIANAESTIQKFKDSKITTIPAELLKIGEKLINQTVNEFSSIIEPLDDKVKELREKGDIDNITECLKSTEELNFKGNNVISNLSVCIEVELKIAYVLIDDFNNIYNESLNNLNYNKEKFTKCSRIWWLFTIALNLQSLKSNQEISKEVSKIPNLLTSAIEKLDLDTLKSKIINCTKNPELVSFVKELSDAIDAQKTCIDQKINEIR